jgi:hypothetical protein
VPSVARWKKQLRSDPELRAKFELFLSLRQDSDASGAVQDWIALRALVEQSHLERGSRRTKSPGPSVPELPAKTPTPDEAQDLPLDVRVRLLQRLFALPAIQGFVDDARKQSEAPTDIFGLERPPPH